MNRAFRLALFLLSLDVAGTAQASPAGEGRTATLLRRTLEAGAAGECPPSLMEAPLLRLCRDQMPAIRNDLARLGRISAVERLGSRRSAKLGPVEAYRVRFAHGQTVWMARSGADGKLAVLHSQD